MAQATTGTDQARALERVRKLLALANDAGASVNLSRQVGGPEKRRALR